MISISINMMTMTDDGDGWRMTDDGDGWRMTVMDDGWRWRWRMTMTMTDDDDDAEHVAEFHGALYQDGFSTVA